MGVIGDRIPEKKRKLVSRAPLRKNVKCQSVFRSDVAFAHIFGPQVLDESKKRFCMKWRRFVN